MQVNVILLCYNESILLPHTVNHYRRYIPSCKITIYDNESSDNSVEIAKALGCDVVSWGSNNVLDEFKQTHLRNTVWKDFTTGWIIMADMDEFVCVTEQELYEELTQGTTILKIEGRNMIGESLSPVLDDIDIHAIEKNIKNDWESKNLVFRRECIIDMNYNLGSHKCSPKGEIVYSKNTYINKHMDFMGLPFLINKITQRYNRTEELRKLGFAWHYTDNCDVISSRYYNALHTCEERLPISSSKSGDITI